PDQDEAEEVVVAERPAELVLERAGPGPLAERIDAPRRLRRSGRRGSRGAAQHHRSCDRRRVDGSRPRAGSVEPSVEGVEREEDRRRGCARCERELDAAEVTEYDRCPEERNL